MKRLIDLFTGLSKQKLELKYLCWNLFLLLSEQNEKISNEEIIFFSLAKQQKRMHIFIVKRRKI